jgi:hypothetical protein
MRWKNEVGDVKVGMTRTEVTITSVRQLIDKGLFSSTPAFSVLTPSP